MASYGKGTTNKVSTNRESTIVGGCATLIFGIPFLTGLLGFMIWFNLFIWGEIF